MHVRRALLLFAIVLGLAAIAASVSRQPEESGERAEQPAPAEQQPEPSVSSGTAPAADGTIELTFNASRDQRRRLDAGQPASVLVEVDEPGLVEIPDLGLSAPADSLTPARFEVLVPNPRRLDLTLTPVDGDESRPVGTLVVRAVEE